MESDCPKESYQNMDLAISFFLEEMDDGILIRATQSGKLSWEDTYKQMAEVAQEEWDDWHNMDVDLDDHL